MMEPNFHFNDVLVTVHQARLKELWEESVHSTIGQEQSTKGRIRTTAGNLLIRWGERVSGCERQAAASSPHGRFVAS
jgi:hypothetical protein